MKTKFRTALFAGLLVATALLTPLATWNATPDSAAADYTRLLADTSDGENGDGGRSPDGFTWVGG